MKHTMNTATNKTAPSVAELEQQLLKAKEQQAKDYESKLLKDAEAWVGKAYSSHLFQRVPAPSKEIVLRKITSIEVSNNRVYYIGLNICFRLHPKSNIFKVEIIEGLRSESPFPTWISSFNNEISADLFDTVLIEAKAHAETYFDKMRGLFTQHEYISQGDSTTEDTYIKLLKNNGFPLITLKSNGYNSIKDLLSWNKHPFVYGYDQLLYTKESIELVKAIAEDMISRAREWGGSILDRDYPRYEKMMSFYNEHIANFK